MRHRALNPGVEPVARTFGKGSHRELVGRGRKSSSGRTRIARFDKLKICSSDA